MKSSLNRRLHALVTAFGMDEVRKALSEMNTVGPPRSPIRANRKARGGKSLPEPKQRRTPANRHILRACEMRPDAKPILEKLGTMYQERSFLKDLRDLRWFLRDHKKNELPESRAAGLKQVMETLAEMAIPELEKTLARAVERHEVGDFMLLANAIMGIPNKNTN